MRMRDCDTCLYQGQCSVDDMTSCAHGDNIGRSDYVPKTQSVYIINGVGGSGKSTFISILSILHPLIKEISTVDKVKEVAEFAGWNGEKDEKGRRFLADIKDAMDAYDNLSWKNVDKVIEEDPNCIYFINARSNYDIDYFKKRWNAKTILIERPGTPLIFSNHADAGVMDYNYDIVICNDGNLENLRNKAIQFLLNEKI